MANCCFCDFIIKFETETEKESFLKDFEADINKANKEGVGVFFGNDNCYLFDSEIFDNDTTTVLISCWVKWCVKDEYMIDFIKYIKNNHNKTYNVQSFKISYEELLNDILGTYEYDGIELINNFLSQEQFDKIYNEFKKGIDDNDAYDEYRSKLYAELNNELSVRTIQLA